ncbi:MAG TPA: hypothetical protein VFA15_05815 [Nitrososphaera sp.]|nr:hypothetical protein [Nitrososphaera sp.]
MSNDAKPEEMLPIFSIASNNFDRDLMLVKTLFSGLEHLAQTEHGFRLSERAILAAGWWFYDVYCTPDFATNLFETVLPSGLGTARATTKITEALQGQLLKYGSGAAIKIHPKLSLSQLSPGPAAA